MVSVKCKEDWKDDCTWNGDCCSNKCEIKINWVYGVCKPNVTSTTTNKMVTACKKDWDDTCSNDTDCCSSKCDKQNDGKWDFGVCSPKVLLTTKQKKITASTTTTTTKIYNNRGTAEPPKTPKPNASKLTTTLKTTTLKPSTIKPTFLTQPKNKVPEKTQQTCECVCKNSQGKTCNPLGY